jgi:hypothetical protein
MVEIVERIPNEHIREFIRADVRGHWRDSVREPARLSRRRRRSTLALGLVAAMAALRAAPAAAQCVPPKNSNEARLLAFYEAPIVFSTIDAPDVLPLGGVALAGELAGVPAAGQNLQETNFCFAAKQDATHLSPLLPRLRVEVGLGAGLAIEGSYLPPVTVDRAKPNLGSLALSYTRALIAPAPEMSGPILTFQLRAHGTVGTVQGPITCPRSSLQTTNPGLPCYGTQPSNDTFSPNSVGGEGTLGLSSPGGRVSAFAGTGFTWLAPHFRVGFTDLEGVTDHTLVEVDLQRGVLFGGVDFRIFRALDASAEVYSVPADLTTWRLAARYRLR